LECGDSGAALDSLGFLGLANPKLRRAALAAALQICFSAAVFG